MQPKEVNNLKMNIYATMAYFDIFDYPLTIDEIGKYLLWANAERNELWTFLNNDPGIQRYGDYYFFKGRRAIVDTRREREAVSERFWRKEYNWVASVPTRQQKIIDDHFFKKYILYMSIYFHIHKTKNYIFF